MDYRIMDDGSWVYIRNPPKSLPGFTRHPNNPNRFIPDFIDCKHRTLENYVKPCGLLGKRFVCKLLCREVNPAFCEVCDKVEE